MIKRLLASAALGSALIAPQAHADTWGCEVLLCLSNPAGPMAVSACVPPITRLYKAIFKWRPDPFPTCLLSNGLDSSTGGNYARVGPPSYYDACPAGMTDAAKGAYVAAGSSSSAPGTWRSSVRLSSEVFTGIGSGAGLSPDWEGNALPLKVCVGNAVATTSIDIGTSWDDRSTIRVTVYDKIATIRPAGDTFNINVVINGEQYTNVRPFSQTAATFYQ